MNNNDDRIYFCDMKDLKKGSFKAWCRDRVNDATNFYDEHKEFINVVAVPVTLALIGLGKSGIRSAQANHRRKMEQRDKDMRFYDPSLKCWWQLNRRMTSTDKVMIAKRRAKGEKVASILKDMNLV